MRISNHVQMVFDQMNIQPDDFKNLYCDVNHITDRDKHVDFYSGVVNYGKVYQKL